MKKVVAIGELLIDFVPQQRGCALDEVVQFERVAGGAPANVATAVARLGGRAQMISQVGEDAFGTHILKTLHANGMNIKLTDAAYDKIVAEGTDLTNGARPLRRAIQKLIEDPLSEELLAGEWGEGDTVLCDVADGKFVFSRGTGEIPAPRPAGTLGGDTAPAVPHTGTAAAAITVRGVRGLPLSPAAVSRAGVGWYMVFFRRGLAWHRPRQGENASSGGASSRARKVKS